MSLAMPGRPTLAGALALLLTAGCAGEPVDLPDDPSPLDPSALTEQDVRVLRQLWPLPAVPPDPTNAVADDPWAQHFGRYLFFEESFSSTGTVSCATCHDPARGWGDDLRVSNTLAPTARHAPTLVNTAYQRWQFWDGRCDSQWCQATHPFEDPAEMGGDRVSMARTVFEDPSMHEAYVDLFGELPPMDDPRFPAHARPVPADPDHPHHQAWLAMAPEDRTAVSRAFVNLAKAIAAYERQIVSRDAPFDDWARALLLGESDGRDLLSPAARRGYKHFIGDGLCITCHAGPTFSNHEFHNVGVGSRDWLDSPDEGRAEGIVRVQEDPFNGAKAFSDDPDFGREKLEYLVITPEQDGQFKTPGLRDVALHPPYNHGGHFDTLEEVVENYIVQSESPQYGHSEELIALITMTEDDIPDLVAFMDALTGAPLPDELLVPPDDPRYDAPVQD